MQGKVINNISNTYFIEYGDDTYEAVARGKFKFC